MNDANAISRKCKSKGRAHGKVGGAYPLTKASSFHSFLSLLHYAVSLLLSVGPLILSCIATKYERVLCVLSEK